MRHIDLQKQSQRAVASVLLILVCGSALFSGFLLLLHCSNAQHEKETVDSLLQTLRTDPARRPDETRQEWFGRIKASHLAAANAILSHPAATVDQKREAAERMLTVLANPRDPESRRQLVSFAEDVVRKFPSLAAKASHSLIQERIRSDPHDPMVLSEIDDYAKRFPDKADASSALYLLMARKLWQSTPAEAEAVLDHALGVLPATQATRLRHFRNRQTMVGTTLTFRWPTLDGTTIALPSLQGKVVHLYSWATWCAPCVEKFPTLREIYRHYHSEGYEIIAVSQDEDLEQLRGFLSEQDLPWITVLKSSEFERIYGPMGTPESILLDQRGAVVARGLYEREELEIAIRSLLRMR